MRLPHSLTLILYLLITASLAVGGEPGTGMKSADFSADPGWEGHLNHLRSTPPAVVRQDFGPSDTHFAGGKAGGEIGGVVGRGISRASYAKVIEPKTLNDRLSASGRFSVNANDGGSGALFGWFNDAESRGWRTNNSLVLRFDGNIDRYFVFFEYGTRTWRAAGKGCFEGDRWQTTKSKPMRADGSSHTWSMNYDPNGAAGAGLITFVLDGETYELPLEPGHKDEGATFDRFGLLNQMTSGGVMETYFDDVTLDGKPLDSFAEADGWEAKSNRGAFPERFVFGEHDFGHSPRTAHAGGKPGEIGGVVWRSGKTPSYYADRVGPLSLKDDVLTAEGTVAFLAAGSDSGVYIGWFDSATRKAKTTEETDDPAKDMLGVYLEGPSRVGHYFRPFYRTSKGDGGPADAGPLIRPDGQVHRWSLRYDPAAAEGRGQITVTFDGQKQAFDLAEGHREHGGTFDRFGLFCQQQGGHYVEVYLDDLKYTVSK